MSYKLFFVLLLAFVFCQLAMADVAGMVQGTVTDPSGAAVPNATVTLTNPHTGWTHTTRTNVNGQYEFLAVPVGEDYRVDVEASGLEKTSQTGITLLVNQVFRADSQLKMGSVHESVVTSAAALQVETSSTQLGDVIGSQKMVDLPLNGRSYTDLLGLQPGVVPITSSNVNNSNPVSGSLNPGLVSVNGARESDNAFYVNGADVEESENNGAAIIPTLDSIAEFRILTNSYDAEYGRFSGGIVNVITKSGTNSLHGSAYEFLRNDDFDARNYFNPEAITGPKGAFKQNQFGGTVGGPIIKGKLFFFGDYQGTRLIQGQTQDLKVPSTLERGGNFSDVSTTGYNPLTGTVEGGAAGFAATLTQRLGYTVNPTEPYWVAGCNTVAQAQAQMCVFPNQTIPQTAFSPAASGTLSFIPTTNGTNGINPTFGTSAYNNHLRDDKFGARIDWHAHSIGDLAFYYHFDNADTISPYAADNVPGFAATQKTRGQNFSLRNTHTFGAVAVNEAVVSFTRYATPGAIPSQGLGTISSFGFVEGGQGIVPPAPAYEGSAQINLQQLGLTTGTYQGTTKQSDNTYSLADNYSRVVGNHTLKFGTTYRWFEINLLLTYDSNGQFFFNGGETGNDFADYLIGAPQVYYQASPGALDARTRYFGLYGQDSYKVTPNLTINYGLRWDITRPWSDTKNRLQTFIPGKQSVRFPGAPENWNFAGDPGIPDTIAPTRYDKFAPRLGFAYSPSAKEGFKGKLFGGPGQTSIRGGAGVYYTAFEQISNLYELGNSPFAIFYPSPVLIYFEEPFVNRLTGQNLIQPFPYVSPTGGNSVNWATFQPVSGQQSYQPSNTIPYMEQFNFNIQRSLGGKTVATLGYVGSVGRHLIAQTSANPGNPALCLSLNAAALAPGQTPCAQQGENGIYELANGTYQYGTRPYSVTSGRFLSQGQLDFGDLEYVNTKGASNYNSFQASIKRQAGDLTLLGSYTYSKSMDDMSGFTNNSVYINPFDPALSRGLSSFNITHNFVASYTYALPLAKWAGLSSGALYKAANGWQLSGITRFTTGLPVLIVQSGDNSLCGCEEGGEPDWNGQRIQFLNPRKNNLQYFSTTQFSPEPVGQFGTARHYFFSGPGLNNWDMALEKVTGITERSALQFRFELFNTFNHPQFNAPGGDFNSPASFGFVSSARAARVGQAALKLTF
jgi:carboxypeptidase family protein